MNITSDYMSDLRHLGITVDDENFPAHENIPDEVTQPEDGYKYKSEVIIRLSQSKNLHNTKSFS